MYYYNYPYWLIESLCYQFDFYFKDTNHIQWMDLLEILDKMFFQHEL